MDLTLGEEQQSLIDGVAAYLADRLPITRLHDQSVLVRRLDPQILKSVGDMGWMSATLDEAVGGSSLALIDEVLIFRELGRVVAPMCLLAGAVAARAAANHGQPELATAIASGEAPVAFAARGDYDQDAESLASRRLYEVDGARWALAVDGDRVRIFDLAGRNLEPADCLDKTTTASIADMSQCEVLLDVRDPGIRRAGGMLVSAMLAGLGETARDLIVEYAKIRTTFGKPIGAYQAVRHPCADMEVRAAQAKCQLYYASLAVEGGLADQDFQVAAAKVVASASAFENAWDSIQLHGGIGITDDYHVHLVLKRAHLIAPWFGAIHEHLDEIIPSETSLEAA